MTFQRKVYFVIFVSVFVLVGAFHTPTIFAEREDEANKCYLDAYNLYKSGKMEQSLELLKKVVELNPDHAEAHFGMGSIYFRQNMFDDAVKEFTKVTRLKPEYVEAYQRLWLAYKKLGMNDKAEEELQKYKKLIEERMQTMGGGSPQVAKPVAPPPKEEPSEKPKPEEPKQTEAKADASRTGEARPVDTIVLEKKPAESRPPATETKMEKPAVVKPGIPTQDDTRPPVVSLRPPGEELKQAVKSPFTPQTKPIEIKVKPESVGAQPTYIKVDKKDPAYKNLFKPFKKVGVGIFQNPFKKKDGKGPKTYAGKLIKGLLSYVFLVQIWLCIVAALCVYFVRTKRE